MITNIYVNQAIDYILTHINEELTVDKIASHCHFSRYYFSRMFKIEIGESIGEFIRRLKMERSAFRIKIERNRRITDIGHDYGYSSSNYSAAFKQYHEVSPIEFRRNIVQKSLKNPFYDISVNLEAFEVCKKKITIETFADFTAVYLRHKGNYKELSKHWEDLQTRYREHITEETLFMERAYDDPSITDTDECLCDIYMTVPKNCDLDNKCVIQGGKFAVYHFKGSVKQIYNTYQSIFNVWIPKSGYEIDERYNFDIYRMIDCDTMNMEIDICIPVE